MTKKASDLEIGDMVIKHDGNHSAGTIISKMDDPERITKTYFLVRSPEGAWTIYGALKNTHCELYLTRNIPEAVMRKFLFDAFVGVDLVYNPELQERIPLLNVPTYETKAKQKRAIIPKPEETKTKKALWRQEKDEDQEFTEDEEPEKPIEALGETKKTEGAEDPLLEEPIEEPTPVEKPMGEPLEETQEKLLPEFSFIF